MKMHLAIIALFFAMYGNGQTLNFVRELSELNNPTQTDAFPYITDDGLRLYYTNNASGNNIYFTSRPDLSSEFAPKQLLDSATFAGVTSCWLTQDELELYYSASGVLFHASRPTIASPFGAPTTISFVGGSPSFIAGQSFTPGLEELYFFNGNGLVKYEFTNSTTFTFVEDVLSPVAGYEGTAAQLSKDGLELFWSLRHLVNDSIHLFKLDRASIGDDFANPVKLNSLINTDTWLNAQASYASSANVLVWVRNDDNLWDGNELFIAQEASAGFTELVKAPKEVLKIVDIMGRETLYEPNKVLIYMYSDGSSERVYTMEN